MISRSKRVAVALSMLRVHVAPTEISAVGVYGITNVGFLIVQLDSFGEINHTISCTICECF